MITNEDSDDEKERNSTLIFHVVNPVDPFKIKAVTSIYWSKKYTNETAGVLPWKPVMCLRCMRSFACLIIEPICESASSMY